MSASSPSVKSMSSPVVHESPFGAHWLPGKDPVDTPNVDVTFGRATPPLSTTLITPAMASEPYCAAAPSRSTSM